MPKQLQTALEALQFCVFYPDRVVEDVHGAKWSFDTRFHCWRFNSVATNIHYPNDSCAPFTIIDEPEQLLTNCEELKTDPQTGERVDPEWYAETKKQPEWVRVEVDPSIGAGHTVQSLTHEIYSSERMALRYICQHAQQVRITWPEWINSLPDHHDIDADGATLGQADFIDQALRMNGAVVEYLPKEGK